MYKIKECEWQKVKKSCTADLRTVIVPKIYSELAVWSISTLLVKEVRADVSIQWML